VLRRASGDGAISKHGSLKQQEQGEDEHPGPEHGKRRRRQQGCAGQSDATKAEGGKTANSTEEPADRSGAKGETDRKSGDGMNVNVNLSTQQRTNFRERIVTRDVKRIPRASARSRAACLVLAIISEAGQGPASDDSGCFCALDERGGSKFPRKLDFS
jgi:hypothetical protein